MSLELHNVYYLSHFGAQIMEIIEMDINNEQAIKAKLANPVLSLKYNDVVNELYSLFLKFSALGLLQNIRNNFHS